MAGAAGTMAVTIMAAGIMVAIMAAGAGMRHHHHHLLLRYSFRRLRPHRLATGGEIRSAQGADF